MESSAEASWVLPLLLAKCAGAADPSRLLLLAVATLLLFLATSILYWSAPGGPAWGKYWLNRRHRPCELIPGPRGLPIIGSINLMLGLAHRHLAEKASALNATRLMALSLGSTRVIITSDPDVAREILNSSAFSDRPIKESAYGLLFDRAIGFAPHGAYWRALRRIASTHLFSPKQISASRPHRDIIARQMVDAFKESARFGTSRPRDLLKRASLHNVMWSVFGRRYELGSDNKEMKELCELVNQGYDLLGKLNLSDHLPFLAFLDPQGVRYSCSRLVPRVNRFVSRIIHEHQVGSARSDMDFVDVLLSLQGSDRLTEPDMVAVLWEMIFRGTDTVAVLIEWVLARMVMHRDVQARVHEELDRVVGVHRAVTEREAGELVYLNAVIKEVLRLHPPGPLLSWARLATEDTRVHGRHVPAGTTAMVNMWAITHDPAVWDEPDEFRPNRFVGPDRSEFPVLGSDLRLAPFGSGRRSCPGKALAMATVSFWVASLMHEFEWAPVMEAARVDLSEVLRLSCEMAAPLTVKLCPRR